ncbi:MAG: hypothetical protein MZV65_19210 [Chromatiales bacterium]|nr:hypothetical protein [Chromatiales bacterium]
MILTINMEVGLITPPVGLNLYVHQRRGARRAAADRAQGLRCRSCC